MRLLLPEAVRRGVRLVTNMGAGGLLLLEFNGCDLNYINVANAELCGS